MELFIGGMAQGKCNYVIANHPEFTKQDVFEGNEITNENISLCFEKPVINHFHFVIRYLLNEKINYESFLTELLDKNPSALILCDEVGLGIVPLDSFEREYRENVGRACIHLAKKAKQVTRIFCGMGLKLK